MAAQLIPSYMPFRRKGMKEEGGVGGKERNREWSK